MSVLVTEAVFLCSAHNLLDSRLSGRIMTPHSHAIQMKQTWSTLWNIWIIVGQFLMCGVCGVFCAKKKSGLILSECEQAECDLSVSVNGEVFQKLAVGLGVELHSILNPKRSHKFIFDDTSPYQNPISTLLASESELSSLPFTDPACGPTIWPIKSHSHFMILFSACCICGLIGGILNIQFLRAVTERSSLHNVSLSLACIGISGCTISTWLTCRLASYEQRRMFLEREHSLHHSHEMTEKVKELGY
ncbi:unnamed protein product [Ranitomeya imitator]|uniref:Transmembrane protein 196 n=1 Tax=Ranitomeya imitator TaxID=111125 RepID=A0ABN9M2D0_9NEOB|nr:unnamed protein product [Ranitomeya imitator]